MAIKLQKISAGHYKYGIYELIRWQPETQHRYLWCLSIQGTGMDDFKTLAKAKIHIEKDLQKVGA